MERRSLMSLAPAVRAAAPAASHGKRPGTIVHREEPFNAETAPAALIEALLTPVDAFYSRNHGPVPCVDPSTWRLRVSGLVAAELSLSLDELRERFEAREVVATLQCAGNRRAGLIAVRDIPGEEPWGPGATGTATWRGVALADVLAAARPHPRAAHVGLAGADVSAEAQPPQPYGVSIPRRKADQPEVLLAWAMNGEPLPTLHGGPIRVVVPGYIGARSVKWLERVELRETPWDGFFQSTAYRLLPPDGEPAPGVGVPLGELALNSEILSPGDGSVVAAGPLELRGYALAGGDRRVVRVDVSPDAGETWQQAELTDDLGRWTWRLWRAEVMLEPGPHEIVVRAWDSAAASQPERPGPLWNPKGYVNNAWGRIAVRAEA
jgi:sulfite oxidase